MKLAIIYNKKNKIDAKLDKKIIKAMKRINFLWYASGCNHITGDRDLAFEK